MMSLGNRLYRAICFVIFAILVLAVSGQTNAEIIHESATMGPTGQWNGYAISEDQFIGSRFYVSETTEVTAIGGHFVEDNWLNIFGAIVTLDDGYDLPSGLPFRSWEVVAFTYFRTPGSSSDIRVPLEITLQPGWYGLVFGAGEFGLSRNAVSLMPGGGQTAYQGSSFFFWDGLWEMWFNTAFPSGPPRFVVESIPAIPPTEIHGNKFNDADGNGNWDDGELAIGGWEFYLDLNTNGILDAGEPNAIADPNGCYEFLDLDPGTYTVAEVMRDGWVQTSPGGAGSYTLVMDVNDIRQDINFGNARPQPGDIRGVKFHDLNGNGIRDNGEQGLANFEIYLDSNNNNKWDSGEPKRQTDSGGNYKFSSVQPGEYVVRERPRAGWAQTLPGHMGGRLFACEYIDNGDRTNINEIDPSDGTVIKRFSIGQGLAAMKAGDLAVGPVSLFFINFRVDDSGFHTDIWELDPDTESIIDYDEIPMDPTLLPSGAAYLDGKVYITFQPWPFPDPPVTTLVRYDPVTDRIEHELTMDIWCGDDLAANPDKNVLLMPQSLRNVIEVDPATGEVVRTIEHEGTSAAFVAYLDGYIYRNRWSSPYTTWVIDPATGQTVNTYNVTGLQDMDGTGADGIRAEEYHVTVGGANVEGLDFGNVQTGTGQISGTIFDDTNANGRQDEGEVGLSGQEVYTDNNDNGTWDEGERTALTNATGDYVFDNLSAGRHIITTRCRGNRTPTYPDTLNTQFLEVAQPRDVIFDDHRQMLYIGTSEGKLVRYDLVNRQFLSPLIFGSELNGMDITPDASHLYVTEGKPSGATGILHKVNLNTGAVQDISYDMTTYETGNWDIKIGGYGKALITTCSTSSRMPLRELELDTDNISLRIDIPDSQNGKIRAETRIFRSDDRKTFWILGANWNNHFVVYNAATDLFEESYVREDHFETGAFDCGNAGSLALNNGKGATWLYEKDFAPVIPFGGGNSGLVLLDESHQTIYYDFQGAVIARDMQSSQVLHRQRLGRLDPYTPFVSGETSISGDGRFIAMTGRTDQTSSRWPEGVYLIKCSEAQEIGVTEGRVIDNVNLGSTLNESGDLNNDKTVDNRDFAVLAERWGENDQCLDIAGDPLDGIVGLEDLAVVAANWLMSLVEPYSPDEDFETGDFSQYPWVHQDNPWTVTTDNAFEGQYCAISADMSRYEKSIIEVTLNVKAGEITFFATQDTADSMLYFGIDGNDLLFADGEESSDWGLYSFPVTEGEHTFTWEYYAREYGIHARLDAISFPPLNE